MISYYTRQEDVYREQMSRTEELFRPSQRLPDQVFRPGYRACFAVEFDQLITRRFWDVVRAIGAETGDQGVTWAVLDPSPDEYYRWHFGYFGVVRFPSSASGDDCLEVLAYEPPDSPADAMLYNARVVVCYPDSAEWLVWGERSLGIAIIALRMLPEADSVKTHSIAKQLENLAWVPLAEATELIAVNFTNQLLPSGFAEKFHANYG
jgi:hypothetical protein